MRDICAGREIKMANIKPLMQGYKEFYKEIRTRIISAKISVARAVDREAIIMYWDIGKRIVEKQNKYKWGDKVVERLSVDLTKEFGDKYGLSSYNLWRMRQFYLEYKESPILARLVPELSWSKNILIMQKVKGSKEREYYLRACAENGWTRNVLLNQINAGAYSHSLKAGKQNNYAKVMPAHLAEQADESMKSVYNLGFLGITKPVLERKLEKRLVERVKHFMLELGAGFCFVGNQYRLALEGTEYFIDLLFFNRKLKSLVAIELKTGKFQPEYAGKMDFYLNLLNDQAKYKDENPAIGIILCADKSKITVEYALKNAKNPVGVAEYRLTNRMPDELKQIMPPEKELKEGIEKERDDFMLEEEKAKYGEFAIVGRQNL
jgi:predicted nuclease of restriction endonuclease-like (RecB) superfamily